MAGRGRPGSITRIDSQHGDGLPSGRFSQRDEFIDERVRCFFQNHSPRAEHGQGRNTNQEKHPDGHFANAESEPDDIRLVNKIQAVGISSDHAEEFSWPLEEQNHPRDACNFKHATRARGEIDENVFVQAVIKL